MIDEFDALENKVSQVASLCRSLRAENAQLRQQLAVTEAERRLLAERMEIARSRLQMLVEQLPETETTL